MSKRTKREYPLDNCLICGAEFSKIKETHVFCTRKCFRRALYLRQRSEQNEAIALAEAGDLHVEVGGNPIYICKHCGERQRLGFDPSLERNFEQWNAYHCISCSRGIGEVRNSDLRIRREITSIIETLYDGSQII